MRNRETIARLLTRVKAAKEPDREIDCRLQVLANGGTGMFRDADAWTKRAIEQGWNVPRHTAYVDAMLVLIKRMLPDYSGRISFGVISTARLWHTVGAHKTPISHDAPTPALALCAALLVALLATTGGADVEAE